MSYGWTHERSAASVIGAFYGTLHGILSLELFGVGNVVIDWSDALDAAVDALLAPFEDDRRHDVATRDTSQ